jgi:hypothetical protein
MCPPTSVACEAGGDCDAVIGSCDAVIEGSFLLEISFKNTDQNAQCNNTVRDPPLAQKTPKKTNHPSKKIGGTVRYWMLSYFVACLSFTNRPFCGEGFASSEISSLTSSFQLRSLRIALPLRLRNH